MMKPWLHHEKQGPDDDAPSSAALVVSYPTKSSCRRSRQSQHDTPLSNSGHNNDNLSPRRTTTTTKSRKMTIVHQSDWSIITMVLLMLTTFGWSVDAFQSLVVAPSPGVNLFGNLPRNLWSDRRPSTRLTGTQAPSGDSRAANQNSNNKNNKRNRQTPKQQQQQQQRNNHNRPSAPAGSKRTQLQWLVNNVDKHYADQVSPQVWQGLVELTRAKNPRQVYEAGQRLERATLTNCSRPVRERCIKAAAMTGLLHLALPWTKELMESSSRDDDGDGNERTASYLPSDIVQNSLCSSLRKVGRYSDLEDMVQRFGRAATENKKSIDLSTFNMYLASLSDQAQSNPRHKMFHNKKKNQRQKNQNSYNNVGRQVNFESPPRTPRELLHRMKTLLTNSSQCKLEFGIAEPDSYSFATVLQAAAKTGNRTLSDEIWDYLCEQQNNGKMLKNTNAYNARLRSLVVTTTTAATPQQRRQDDAEALALWQELQDNPDNKLDRYTIDLMLLPWSAAESSSWQTIITVLDDFCQENSPAIVSQAFESFLSRLCQSGATSLARAIFNRYIRPYFSSMVSSLEADPRGNNDDDGAAKLRLVQPQTMHFNILLGGYRKMLRDSINNYNIQMLNQERESSPLISQDEEANESELRSINVTGQVEVVNLRKEAWQLFSLMRRSHLIEPDVVTITTMMGCCRTSSELCHLLSLVANGESSTNHDAQEHGDKIQNKDVPSGTGQHNFMSRSALLRAAITRFGELGDVSSAFWMFLRYGTAAQQRHVRLWNVLLGAVSKACEGRIYDANAVVSIEHAAVAKVIVEQESTASQKQVVTSIKDHALHRTVEGCSYPEAADRILSFLSQRSKLMLNDDGDNANRAIAPLPDSQSYCLVASALQRLDLEPERAKLFFRDAQDRGIPADGRFVNALIRCFGENVAEAVSSWKSEIRPATIAFENRHRVKPVPVNRMEGKNLLAAYHGLMYCCGRALRPDLAVRLVYAMRKEGLEPSEVSLHSYNAGKRERPDVPKKPVAERRRSFRIPRPSWALVAPYESVLYVECTNYDQNDKRRISDKRVRIIV